MKRLGFKGSAVTILGLLTAVLWWADSSGFLVDRYRETIQKILAEQIGYPLILGRLTGGLWGRVIVHQLEVKDEGQWGLRVDRVRIRVKTLQLIKDLSHPERAIQSIDLVHPIFLSAYPRPPSKGSSLPGWDPMKWLSELEGRWEIRIQEAEIGGIASPEHSLKGLSGTFVAVGGALEWKIRLKGSGTSGEVRGFGRIDGRACRVEFQVDGFDLASLASPLSNFSAPRVNPLAGRLRGEAVYQSPWPPVLATSQINVKSHVKGLQIGSMILGDGSVSIVRGSGDAHHVAIRMGEGTSKTLSVIGTISGGPDLERVKTDLTWNFNDQPLAGWIELIAGKKASLDWSGTVRGEGRMAGLIKRPLIQGGVQAQRGRIAGNAYESISGSMWYLGETLKMAEATWQGAEDRVGLRGLQLSWREGIKKWRCEEIRLEPYRVLTMNLIGGVAVTGSSDSLGGWSTRLEFRDLFINGFPYGHAEWRVEFDPRSRKIRIAEDGLEPELTRVTVGLEGEDLVVDPSTVRLPKGILRGQGKIRPHDLNLRLQGLRMDVEFALKALGVGLDGEGAGQVDLHLTGAPENPRVDGSVDIVDGRLALWPFKNLSGQLAIKDQWMYFKSWTASSPERFTLTVSGKVPLMSPPQPMSLVIGINDGRMDMLMPFGWFRSLEGSMKGRLHLSGTPAEPMMNGELVMSQAILRPKGLVEEIRNGQGRLTLRNNRGTLEECSGTVEGAPIQVKGMMEFREYVPFHMEIGCSTMGKTVAVNLPGLMPPEAKARMNLGGLSDDWFKVKGVGDRWLIQGKVVLSHGQFTWPPRYFEEGEKDGHGKVSGATQGEFLNHIDLDVGLEIGERLVFFNDYVEVSILRGDRVTLLKSGRIIQISGAVHAEGGSFRYLNHIFKITAGKVIWVKDDAKVYVTATAETEFQGYRFTAEVRGKNQKMGSLDDLTVALSSDPPLTQQQIASLLTVGVDTTHMTEEQVSQKFQEQLGQIMVSQGLMMGTRQALRSWREKVGLDELSFGAAVDSRRMSGPLGGSQGGQFTSWQVGIGKYITSHLFLGTNVRHGYLEGIPYWYQEFLVNVHFLNGYYLETKYSEFDQTFFLKKSFPLFF